MEEIISAISNVGFPIVCCILLGYLIYLMQKQHKSEVEKMVTAINNNSTLLQQVLERLRD